LCLALLGTVALVVGCDTSVQPFVSSDQYHYSIFGILNPAEDTQWVRVEPISGPSRDGASRALDATVRLEHVESGQTWGLRDSVMEVVSGEPKHNFWTTAPIAAGATYRLVVWNEEGDTTQATTTTPDGPPPVQVEGDLLLPCSEQCPDANAFEVSLRTGQTLAGMKVRYFQTFQGVVTGDYDWYDEVTRRERTYEVTVNYLEDLRSLNSTMQRTCIADSAKVITAVGGEDWPQWAHYHDASLSTLARPDSFSNVQGGHGMLAGVYTDTTLVEAQQRQTPPQCGLF
jgi:hypothetical protein